MKVSAAARPGASVSDYGVFYAEVTDAGVLRQATPPQVSASEARLQAAGNPSC